MCSSFYLAALAAMAAMMRDSGHPGDAVFYEDLARAGAASLDAHLFNGEYYAQQVTFEGLNDTSFADLVAGITEESPPGEGFLADVCREWEAATLPAERAGIRVVKLRIGVVLARSGGALPRMLFPFRLGLGGPVGSGRQFLSWIELGDLVAVIRHAVVESGLHGPVNAVAPGIIRTRFHASMTPEQRRLNLESRIPLHREGKPEDVASLICELAENDYITGETIAIDGGLTMRIA